MDRHRVRRADGKYLAEEERGGYFWTDQKDRAATFASEPDARQFITLFASMERLPMEPEPADGETITADE